MIKLSNRLEEVCRLVAKGYMDKEIAIKLDISLATVKLHLWKLKRKFKVSNRTLLAIKYLYDRNIILFGISNGKEYIERFKEAEDESVDE